MGMVFNGIHVLGQDPVDSRPVLCKFFRMGSCSALVVWILIRMPVHDPVGSSAFFGVFLFLFWGALFVFVFVYLPWP